MLFHSFEKACVILSEQKDFYGFWWNIRGNKRILPKMYQNLWSEMPSEFVGSVSQSPTISAAVVESYKSLKLLQGLRSGTGSCEGSSNTCFLHSMIQEISENK